MSPPGRSFRLTPELVQAVREAVDVLDIASDLTSLKRQGRKYVGLCPFHKEKTPSFQIDPEIGLYHCFGCGAGGDAIKLHMESSGDDFPGAIEALAQRYAIPLPEVLGSPRQPIRDLTAALEAAQGFFRRQLMASRFARDYLDRRRIPEELRDRFGLGYAPDGWQNLLDHLRGRVDPQDLQAAGLVARSEKTGNLYDRFRHRLMFPIHSHSGRLVGFGGRTLGDDRAKYVNTAETDFFHKSELLYGLNLAKRPIRDSGRAVLVEGYFDVLGAAASGLDGAVAGMGTALTPEQARLLGRYGDEVVLAYDGDAAGDKAAGRAVPILLAAGLSVRRAPFPAGHDPDSLRLETGPEAVRQLVAEASDAVWLEIERLSPEGTSKDPKAQSTAARAVVSLLEPIRDRIVRSAYARRAAQRLGISEDILLRRRGIELYDQAIQKRAEVRTEEEKALSLLLAAGMPLPEVDELPPPEVFLDVECRNIYSMFCALYRDGRRAPDAREVISGLSESGQTLDQAARLLLEEPVPEEGQGLLETLEMLRNRWQRRRGAELRQEILLAEQNGDQARLTELLEEKKILSRHLHPKMTGRLW